MTIQLPEIQLGEALRQHGMTISTAESCTGGLIAHLLTNVPGSSAYLPGGVVAYSNAVKQHMLQGQTLTDYGAVSEETAQAMAVGAKALFKTDFALSVTGIAGPGGGTAAKPVGLTYIGLAGPDDLVIVEKYIWQADREGNKKASAGAALRLALKHLLA